MSKKKKEAHTKAVLLEEQSPIVIEAAKYVFELIKTKFPTILYFHNFSHTRGVVNTALEIAIGSGLDKEQQEIIALAAWFHDVGYTVQMKNHEEKSVGVAKEYLTEKNYPADKIELVCTLIESTEMHKPPQNLLEEIMKDADLHHLGTDEQESLSTLLRLEYEELTNEEIDEVEWLKKDYEFLKKHKFYTEFATAVYQPVKIKNLLKIRKKLDDIANKSRIAEIKSSEKAEESKLKKIKNSKPERGIETMFRVTMRNHISLSQIADNKANIVLSINAIIISIVLSTLLPDLAYNQYLIFPTVVLISVCIITIIFAILATIPKMNNGQFTKQDIKERKSNLLFFGNFHKMDIDEFQWGFTEMMNDRDFLYGSMTRDFYYLGNALGKKYKYLNICYKVFMYGLIVSILCYVFAYVFFNSPGV